MFQSSGDVSIKFQNLTKGNDLTKTMKSGEMVVCGKVFPFVLQKLNHGNLQRDADGNVIRVAISCFEQSKTLFTKNGYVSLLLTFGNTQVYIYLKRDLVGDFFSSISISAVDSLF